MMAPSWPRGLVRVDANENPKGRSKPTNFFGRGPVRRSFRAEEVWLAGDSTALAYKEFTADIAVQIRSAQTSVAFRAALNTDDRTELDNYFAWPRAVVKDSSDRVCGLLMPLIPDVFYGEQVDPDTGMMSFKLRTMDWLTSSEKQRAAAHFELANIDKTERLILLTQLVYAIRLLHKHGWVFGDLNLRGVAFALNPPRILLFDCGCYGAISDSSRRRFSTPFWDPPEHPITPAAERVYSRELPDAVTDVYKLGLAILRCLTPGRCAATSRAISRLSGELDGEGASLLGRALSADRAARPTVTELSAYFGGMVSRRVGVPELISTRLTARVSHGSEAVNRPQRDHASGAVEGAEQHLLKPTTPRRPKVFLCHSSSDKPSVRTLRRRLLEDGCKPWLDEEDILPGQDWDREIRRAIRTSDLVLVCLSKTSVNKVGYLQKEIKDVLDVADEQPEGTIFVIPARLELCEVPDRLRRWNWVDLFEDTGYSRLLRAVQNPRGD
jgi:hypothetical protein